MKTRFVFIIAAILLLPSLNSLNAMVPETGNFITPATSPPVDTLKIKMCSTTSTTADSGLFYDSGGPEGNYGSSESCLFEIHVNCADSIRLEFNSFYTESCCDALYIYDKPGLSSRLIAEIKGSSFPSSVTAKGDYMRIYFYSDGGVSHSGWEAFWKGFVPDGVSPVADFTIEDTNPPFLVPVQFTDQSTNNPVGWEWDFGDSDSSFLQNPTHAFSESGEQAVTLVADNCFHKDTVTKTLTVQPPPAIELLTDSLIYDAYSCDDSIEQYIEIKNSGTGDLIYFLDTKSDQLEHDTSTIYYSTSGATTTHIFEDITSGNDSIYLQIVINGDFDGSSEYATLFIDGNNMGVIEDWNQPNGIDIVANYSFGGDLVSSWLSDDMLIIDLVNSSSVGNFGNLLHKVILTIPRTKWIQIPHPEGKASPGETVQVPVIFNWKSIEEGSYSALVKVHSNDTSSQLLTTHCLLSVDGDPELIVSDTLISFDTTMLWVPVSDSLVISNTGCDSLVILEINSSSPNFIVDTFELIITPGFESKLDITFIPDSAGPFNGSVEIKSNAGDTIVQLAGWAIPAPDLTFLPDSVIAHLDRSNDSVIVTVSFENKGGGDGSFTMTGINSSHLTKVLALTYGVDYNSEYKNTISAINSYFWDYELTEINTTSPEILRSELEGYHVLLIADQEYGSGTVFTGFAPVLTDYVTAGGMVIFCGTSNSNCLINSGLFHGQYFGSPPTGYAQKVVKNDHPLADGLPDNFTCSNKTYTYTFTDINLQVVADDTISPSGTVAFRKIGNGFAVYIGFNYSSFNTETSRIIANGIKWAGNLNDPEWFTISPDTGIVPANTTLSLEAKFYSLNLAAGYYEYELIANTNDPHKPEQWIPVRLTITGTPELFVADSSLDFGEVQNQSFNYNWLTINNIGNDVLHITDMTTGSDHFLADSMPPEIPPFDSTIVLVYYTPQQIGQHHDTLHIISDGGEAKIALTGTATGRPEIMVYPDTLYAVMYPGDSLTLPVTVSNQGDEPLLCHMEMDYISIPELTGSIFFDQESLIIAPGQADTVTVNFFSYGINSGTVLSHLYIYSNDPVDSFRIVFCQMDLIGIPEADFSYEQEGCSPTVRFTDQTANVATQWSWDFGDGTGSSLQNPIHNYTGAGSYDVTLLSCNDLDCDSITKTVDLMSISGPKPAVCIPDIIDPHPFFTIQGVKFNTIDNNVNNEYADYEDFSCEHHTEVYVGASYDLTVYADSFMVRAWIDYNNNGWFDASEIVMDYYEYWINEHTVEVIIPEDAVINTPLRMRLMIGIDAPTDMTGNCDSIYNGQTEDYSVLIRSDAPPVASFDYVSSFDCDGYVDFNDFSINNPEQWLWDFGDGIQSTEEYAYHVYDSSMYYNVKLVVSNEYGSDSTERTIFVKIMDPVIITDEFLYAGQTFELSEVAADATEWVWEFVPLEPIYGRSVEYRFDEPGDYLVYLYVRDDSTGCSFIDSIKLKVRPLVLPPVAIANYVVIDECNGKVMFFDHSGNNPISRQWKFEEGIYDTAVYPVHQFNESGNYQVMLIATNEAGSDTTTLDLSINNVLPEMSMERHEILRGAFIFNDIGTGGTSWIWDFDNGDSAFVQSPIHVFDEEGYYHVKLIVQNDFGCQVTEGEFIWISIVGETDRNEYLSGIQIFPNPTKDLLNISLSKLTTDELILDIVDPSGRIIYNTTITGNDIITRTVELTKQPQGVYLVRIWKDNLILTRRIIKH